MSASAMAAASPGSSPSAPPAARRLERRRGGRRRRRRHGLWRVEAAHGRAVAGGHSARSRRIAGSSRRHALGVGARVGRFQVDDVAQEHFSFVELVAPDDDGLEGERAFAEARDHRLAAGLDALGDGDLALAGEQLHRAHLAQIHAHRVVGALRRLAGLGLGRRLGRGFDQFAAFALFLFGLLAGVRLLLGVGLLGLDDVDAHLAHHRQHVLDLLGGDLLGRHDRIELLVGDVATLLGLLDHLLDRRIRQVEQRQRGVRSLGRILLGGLGIFRRRGRLLHGDLGPAGNGLGDFLGGLFARALVRHRCLLHLRRSRMRLPLPYGDSAHPGWTPTVRPYPMRFPPRGGQTHPCFLTDHPPPGDREERSRGPNKSPYPMRRESESRLSQGHFKHLLTLTTAHAATYSLPPNPTGPANLHILRQNAYSVRGERPEETPKPSTSASVPSSVDSLAFTSHSRA